MAASPEWDPSGGLSFSDLTPGQATASQTLKLDNDEDGSAGADPIYRGLLRIRAKLAGGDWQSDGLAVLDQRMVQVQVVAGRGGLAVTATGWLRVGPDLPFMALEAQINTTEGEELAVRIDVPASAVALPDVDLEFRLDDERAVELADGVYQAGGQGILNPIRDDSRGAGFWEAVTVVPAGTPDDTAVFSDALWWDALGVPHVEIGHAETISADDGDASALTGTFGYKLRVSYGTGSGVTLTKGSKADPVASATAPATPAGEKNWGTIDVTLTGGVVEINAGDISQHIRAYPETAALVSTSGLTETISGWQALAGNRQLREGPNQVITYADDTADQILYLRPGGTAEAGTSSPMVWSLPVRKVTAAAGVITVTEDQRTYLDHLDHVIGLAKAVTITTAGVVVLGVAANPTNRTLYLRPNEGALIAALFVDSGGTPASLGYSSGSWIWGLEILEPGGSWTTMFTSGPETRAPAIAWDATTSEDRDALAEVLALGPGAQLRATIDGTGLGGAGTPAVGAAVITRWR